MTQATPLLTQFYIFCLIPLRVVLRAKFGVFSFIRYGDMEGSQNSKCRSRDPAHAPLNPNLHFCIVPHRILLRAKFGVSSFTRYGDMDDVPKFKK